MHFPGHDRRSRQSRLESSGMINATFEFPQGHINLADPRHPLTLDSLRDYWGRVWDEGVVNLEIRRNGTETDRVKISLSGEGAEFS